MKQAAAADRKSVWPGLLVENVAAEMEFLQSVFGARIEKSQENAQGTAWQIRARLGTATLLIGHAASSGTQPCGALYVWTQDVSGAYARAMERGAVVISPPASGTSGKREAGFRDPQGIIWWVGERARRPGNREVERRLAEQRSRRS